MPINELKSDIQFSLIQKEGLDFEIHFDHLKFIQSDNFVIKAALLGFGIERKIKSGENAGKRLKHDFVVTNFIRQALKKNSDKYSLHFKKNQWHTKKQAIVVWVEKRGVPKAIQTLATYLP